jgi:lycopene cyclase domain-containing protein
MSTYLLINLLIIIFPLLLSFDKKTAYYKNLPRVFISVIIIGAVFLVWDSIAVKRGDWSFNGRFVGNITLFDLPLEEILFFITVPYSCIFIYEVLRSYLREKQLKIKTRTIFLFAAIFAASAFVFRNQYYTFTVLLFSSLFLIAALLMFNHILRSKIYWLTILITYIPFLIVNYVLTSLPVVSYNENAIWGYRILTIPIEDFFYSYSMISFFLLIYLMSGKSPENTTNA